MRSMSMSNHNRRQSLSSVQRRELNNTKRVHSLGRSTQPIKHTTIQQAKTTRVYGCNNHNSFSPKANPNYNNKLISNTTNNKNKSITNDYPITTNHTTKQPASKLTSIPTLTNPSQITHLDYSSNKITLIPKTMHLTYPNLSSLNLASNQLISIEPICMMIHLRQIHLQCNLINFIPNEIKNLTKLQHLNLSNNKLWYVSQLIGLKELLRVRHHVIGEQCRINLQGNSVVVSNKSSVLKLLQVPVNQKMNINKQLISCKQQEEKQNINPNNINSNNNNQCQIKAHITSTANNSNKHITSTVSKHSKSKSFSQSLLDMSAIIANIPITTNNIQPAKQQSLISLHQLSSIHKHQPQRSVVNNSLSVNRNHQQKLTYNNNELSIRQVISQQLAQKSTPLQQSQYKAMNTLMNITEQQRQLSPSQSSKHCTYKQLFHSIQNFKQQIITPATQYSSILTEIQKKLTLTQKVKGIPQTLKPQFTQVNQALHYEITKTLTILQKLLKYNQLISFDQFSIEIQKLIESYSLKLQGATLSIEQFYSLVVGFYLNEGQEIELRWFQIWGKQYQKLKGVFGNVEKLLSAYLNMWKKVKKLAQLRAIVQPAWNNNCRESIKSNSNPFVKSSPHTKKPPLHIIQPKNNPSILSSSQKKSTSRGSLNKLLFSQSKQPKPLAYFGSQNKQSLLLSGDKSSNNVIRSPSIRNNKRKQQQCSSSWKKAKRREQEKFVQNQDCLQCPLKDQEIIIGQEELACEREKAVLRDKQIQRLKQIISQHKTLTKQHQSLLQTQTKIVTQLHEIKPSTYQHLMYQQALAVQQLLEQKTHLIGKFNNYSQHLNKSITFKSQSLYPNQKLLDQRSLKKQNGKYFYRDLGHEKYGWMINKENGEKKELDGVLLTEESKKSGKKSEKSVSKTYFKSNGTVDVSNPTKEKIIRHLNVGEDRLSLSDKNRPFTIDTKANPSTSSQHNQNSSLTRASFPSRPSPSYPHQYPLLTSSFQEKNQMFEQIIVNEFRNQSNDLNQDQKSHNSNSIQHLTNIPLQQMRNSTHQQVQQKKSTKSAQELQQQVKQLRKISHQNILKNHLINQNQNPCNNSNNSNQYHKKLNIQQQINSNKEKLEISPRNVLNHSRIGFQQSNNPLLSNKTVPNLHLRDKGFFSNGYDYETCNTFETQNYRKYVKYHLRNNIKQLLEQKYQPCHSYDHMVRNTIISTGENIQSSKNQKIHVSLKQKRHSHSIKSQPNSRSCQKMHLQRKYIQKLSLQHGS